jgi:c-di-GMP-binding flagellar brake protein YcgR
MEVSQNSVETSEAQDPFVRPRAFPRHPVDTSAELLLVEHGLALRCRILDLSEGGCRLRTDQTLPDGIRVHVEVAFKLHGVSLRFSGFTQWTGTENEVGIRFGEALLRRRGELTEVLTEVQEEEAAKAERLAAEQRAAEEQTAQLEAEAKRLAENPAPAPPSSPVPPAAPLKKIQLRTQVRYQVDETAAITLIRSGSVLRGRILDLSQSGCRICTPQPFPVGIYTRVEAEFQLHGLPFRLAGVTQAHYDPNNVGIRFLDVSSRKRQQIDQLIQEIGEQRAGTRE